MTDQGKGLHELNEDAQRAVLERIIALSPRQTGGSGVLAFAEAYAYLARPDQAHGGASGGS